MIHDYHNPNTCYAIGDAVADLVGAAATVRRPSAGVEEKITMFTKDSTTDAVRVYNGSLDIAIIAGSAQPGNQQDAANSVRWNAYNTAFMITNDDYIQKIGTNDLAYWGGVQTNS